MCFCEYVSHLRSHRLEIIEIISVGISFRKNGDINDLIAALNWCFSNNIQLINMSIGTQQYTDYFRLRPILKQLYEKNIIVVASQSNNYKFSFPAVSKYTISARFAEEKVVGKDYKIVKYSLHGQEYVVSKMLISDYIKKYIDIQEECNSFAAPIVSALLTNTLFDNSVYIVDNNETLFQKYLNGEELWEFRKQYIKKKELNIPLLLFVGNVEKILYLMKYLTIQFFGDGYTVIDLSDAIGENEIPFINLTSVMMNCKNDIENAILFMGQYSNADLLLVHVNSHQASTLRKSKMSDIIICYKEAIRINTRKEPFYNENELYQYLLTILT